MGLGRASLGRITRVALMWSVGGSRSPDLGSFGRVQALFTVKGIGPIVTIFNRRGMGY